MKSEFPIFRRDSTLKLQIAILCSLHLAAAFEHEQHSLLRHKSQPREFFCHIHNPRACSIISCILTYFSVKFLLFCQLLKIFQFLKCLGRNLLRLHNFIDTPKLFCRIILVIWNLYSEWCLLCDTGQPLLATWWLSSSCQIRHNHSSS